MSKHLVVYDTEIKNGVLTPDNQPQPGFKYAQGWRDFAGMGISTICAYDIKEAHYRVFMDDNLQGFVDLINERDGVVSFNGHRFDDQLLEAHGIEIEHERSIDLAAIIWRAAGIPQGDRPRGLGLDAICRTNNLPIKTGNGADAPQDYQAGRIGRVIDYCLGDVRSTLNLYRYLSNHGGIIDPRDGVSWISVGALGVEL